MKPGQRLCPMCARYTDQADEICRHCGYNFGTGEEGHEVDIPRLSDHGRPDDATGPVPEISTPRTVRPGVRTLVALLVILGLVAPVVALLPVREALEALGEAEQVRPRPGGGGASAPTRASCTNDIRRHLKRLLANDGRGRRPIDELLVRAADDLGSGSFEYDTLVRIYGDPLLLLSATTEGTGPAMAQARRLIVERCRDRYG